MERSESSEVTDSRKHVPRTILCAAIVIGTLQLLLTAANILESPTQIAVAGVFAGAFLRDVLNSFEDDLKGVLPIR